jgi:hypothetical protein
VGRIDTNILLPPGRPRKLDDPSLGDKVLQIIVKNKKTREWSAKKVSVVLAGILQDEGFPVSPRTIHRFLKRRGYKKLKHTTKPGLNTAQKQARLHWALQYKDWTIEDWKRIVWSDESSVVLGAYRGKRRCWRLSKEGHTEQVTRRRWKGTKEFMFWACFAWGHKGPCYIWPTETPPMTARYERFIQQYNQQHEATDRAIWEEQEVIRRSKLKRPPKVPRAWRYDDETGTMVRKVTGGGIDWIRYCFEILEARYMPFMRILGPQFIAQEDNAGPHASKWNRQYWKESGIKVIDWPPNSPDLSAIEPPWRHIKFNQGPVHSKKRLAKIWRKAWKDLPQEKLQRYVDRIRGNIQWVIRQLGDNIYKEGTIPPPLTPEERAKLDEDIEAFLGVVPEPEEPGDAWEDLCEQIEVLGLSDDEEEEEELDTLYDEWVVVNIDRIGRISQRLKIL